MPGDLFKHIGGLCVFVWLFTVVSSVEAQTAGVTLRTTVSETVVLSVAPNSIEGDVRADVVKHIGSAPGVEDLPRPVGAAGKLEVNDAVRYPIRLERIASKLTLDDNGRTKRSEKDRQLPCTLVFHRVVLPASA